MPSANVVIDLTPEDESSRSMNPVPSEKSAYIDLTCEDKDEDAQLKSSLMLQSSLSTRSIPSNSPVERVDLTFCPGYKYDKDEDEDEHEQGLAELIQRDPDGDDEHPSIGKVVLPVACLSMHVLVASTRMDTCTCFTPARLLR